MKANIKTAANASMIMLASAFSAPSGVKIAHRMKPRKLRIAFSFIVIIMGLNLLLR